VRIVGLDVGERRIGIAMSDASGTLATPAHVLRPPMHGAETVDMVASELARLAGEDEPISTIVIGLPRRLDGSPTGMTTRVEAFAAALGARTGLPIVLQDERLTSREAERRLAMREKDWRARKVKLDAAAAAIILQDYLDTRPGRPVPVSDDPEF
jgi:putative Holliday junction resolvase